MSSLTHERGARHGYRLRVYTANGRRSIWLGDLSKADAVASQRHIDEVLAAQTAGLPIPRQTQRWLQTLSISLCSKVLPLLGSAKTVVSMIDQFIDMKSKRVEAATISSIETSLSHLRDHCASMLVQGVERHHLDSIVSELTVADSTKGKIAKDWRAFFSWCIANNAATHNPADHLSTSVPAAKKNFIERTTIDRVIAATDDPHFAAVLALSRYGGLRIPSEVYPLTPTDIGTDRLRVTDTKRSCVRDIPLFPELSPHIDAVRSLHESSVCRLSPSGITSRLLRLLAKTDITPWPKPWHAMRASRETELIRDFGITTACTWIGNSPAVAAKHYAQVSPDDWRRATQSRL